MDPLVKTIDYTDGNLGFYFTGRCRTFHLAFCRYVFIYCHWRKPWQANQYLQYPCRIGFLSTRIQSIFLLGCGVSIILYGSIEYSVIYETHLQMFLFQKQIAQSYLATQCHHFICAGINTANYPLLFSPVSQPVPVYQFYSGSFIRFYPVCRIALTGCL